MNDATDLILHHASPSRSSGVLALLEELGVPYRVNLLNLKAGDQDQPAYRAINPMGKVPAIQHGGALITEQVAIFVYLADRFPQAGLAPAIDDPLRGPYLRWVAFYGSCFEPAMVDRALKRDPTPRALCPYGDFDTTLTTLTDQLARGPALLGDRFSAADILWGTALGWITSFKLVPETPTIMGYVERVAARPAVQRAKAKDAEWAAATAPA